MTFFHKLVSFVFHPIFFSTIGALFYFILSPQHIPKSQENIILIVIFCSTYLLPLALLFLLKRYKMIQSFELHTIEERKFPILFLIVLLYMLGNMLLRTHLVDLLAYCFYGGSISLIIVYFLFHFNIKTSLHTLGMGTIIGFIMILSLEYRMNYLIIIAILFIFFGLLATSRLVLNAHKPFEVYLGLILGILSQFISYQFIYNM